VEGVIFIVSNEAYNGGNLISEKYQLNFLGASVVQIVKFAPDWVTFEHEGKCYSISSDYEFSFEDLSEITRMSFDEVKAKYDLSCESDDESHS
jgi:hypothetical protein